MPVHDWAKAYAGHFHHFHQRWSGEICKALNCGVLPPGYTALIEGRITGAEPEPMAVAGRRSPAVPAAGGGLLVSEAPPEVLHVSSPAGDVAAYAARANRIAVRYKSWRMVALIEVVSPGNKDRRASVERIVRKAVDLLDRGVNLLLIDLFPPTPYDPRRALQTDLGRNPGRAVRTPGGEAAVAGRVRGCAAPDWVYQPDWNRRRATADAVVSR